MKYFFIKYKKVILIAVGAVVAVGILIGIIIGSKDKNANQDNGMATIVTSSTDSVSENTTEEVSSQEETDTQEEVIQYPYTNPLTGEGTMEDYSDRRPVAVMLNTIRQALPQSGNSKADILIEMAEEGGITRVMGIYQDVTGVGNIGTIRSTREYYYSLVQSFDAIMVHAGGDSWVLQQIAADGNKTIDAITRDRGAFWRDEKRLETLSREHTLFTSSENLNNWLANSNVSTNYTKENRTKLNFVDKLTEDYMTTPADCVKVKFSSYKTTSFIYNKETGKYDVFFWDNEPYMDEAVAKQVEVTNIIVLPVPNWTEKDDWGVERQKYDLSGGEGYYISDGEYTKINWTKGDYNQVSEYGAPLNMTTTNGEPLQLATGKTYICVINRAMEVSID